MKTPFPVTFRELWLPQHINGAQLPSSANRGHALTITGGSKQTTVDGVHFTGAANSQMVVAAAAGQNNQASMHITIRFKLDQTFAAGGGTKFLFQKDAGGDDYLQLHFENSGLLHWSKGAAQFDLASTTNSWTAGTWYVVTAELKDGAQTLLVNGTVEDSDTVAAETTANGGDMNFMTSSAGAATGIAGTVSWIVVGVGAAAVDLSADEKAALVKGIPPATAKVQYMYQLDEGRGTACTDRGSAGSNGTLGATPTWQWGQAKTPTLSLDGINDYAAGASGTIIKEPCTLAVVTRGRSTFDTSLADSIIAFLRVGANDYLKLYHNNGADGVEFIASGNGTAQTLSDTTEQVIGDYRVYIATVTSAGVATLYRNGTQVATQAGVGAISGASAIAYLGATNTPDTYGNETILEASLAEGAFTAAQAKAYSRYLRDKYSLSGTFA